MAAAKQCVADAVVLGGRPLGVVVRQVYRRKLLQGAFPHDERITTIPGTDPLHLLFIGSIGVAGYGVLHHGMTAAFRTAALSASDLHRGCGWTEISGPDLTVRQAAAYPRPFPSTVQVAVILLGVTDVIALTPTTVWSRNLERLVDRIRRDSNLNTHVVLAGIPPLTTLTSVGQLTALILDRQTERLNEATMAMAKSVNATYSPFPSDALPIATATFSWRQLHETWAHSLTPDVVGSIGRS